MSDIKKICIGTLILSTIICTAFYVIILPTSKQPTRLNESLSTYDSTSIIVNSPIKSESSQAQKILLSYESYAYIGSVISLVNEIDKIINFINNTRGLDGVNTYGMLFRAQYILQSTCPQQIANFGSIANTFANQAVACHNAKNDNTFLQKLNILTQQETYVENCIAEIKKVHGEQ